MTFNYDGLHRLRTKDYSNDAAQHREYEYDPKSNLKSVTSSAASIGYGGYDALHRFHTHSQVISGNLAGGIRTRIVIGVGNGYFPCRRPTSLMPALAEERLAALAGGKEIL